MPAGGSLVADAVAPDLIANPPDRTDEGAFVAQIDFAPEVINIDVDDIGHGVKIELPNLFDNRSARDRLALMEDEELEQGKLLGT